MAEYRKMWYNSTMRTQQGMERRREQQKQAWRTWYKGNQTEAVARVKRAIAKRLENVNRIKLEQGCRQCGYRRCAEALVFHHPDENKEGSISYIIRRGWSEKRLMDEIAKCVILCANCHAEEHHCSSNDRVAE